MTFLRNRNRSKRWFATGTQLGRRSAGKSRPGNRVAARSAGFTLAACLLILLLMSLLSAALLMMTNTEIKAGGNDINDNVAFHATEGALEKMTADLSGVFSNLQAPNCSDITQGVINGQPANTTMLTYLEYSPQPSCVNGKLASNNCGANGNSPCWGTIQSGPNAGLNAQIVPITLSATVQAGSSQVRMIRTAEVVLIPVFQFGVFSDSDLAFFSGVNLDFAGRIHTNGDLYVNVASCCNLMFHQKVDAYGNVIRQQLPNGLSSSSNAFTGNVYLPSSSGACDPFSPSSLPGSSSSCKSMSAVGTSSPFGDASVQNGPTSSQSGVWPTTVKSKYNGWLLDGNYGNTGGTGATKLALPFVSGGAQPFEIIRRPPPGGDPAGSALSEERLYNQAEIRILLADDPAELPGGAGDIQNIRLANVKTWNATGAPDYSNGVPTSTISTWTGKPSLGATQSFVTMFAEASTAVQDNSAWTNSATQNCLPPDWSIVPITYGPTDSVGRQTLMNYEYTPVNVSNVTSPVFTTPATAYAPLISSNTTSLAPPTCFATAAQIAAEKNLATPASVAAPPTTWNLIDGYLRVEYRDASGAYHPVTQEWLQLGFARGVSSPTSVGGNGVNPNAILILQELADRAANGSITTTTTAGATSGSGSTQKIGIQNPPEVVTDSVTSSPLYSRYDSANPANSTSATRNNWYPINFYDPREGEERDNTTQTAGSCTVNGVMNLVEIDVGNLQRWLAGTIGASGGSVDYATHNGYILYFSDHRGMLANSNPPLGGAAYKTGDSGLEDTINLSAGIAGTPDGVLESPVGKSSPEDDNLNGVLDNFGANNLGLGFNVNNAINPGSSSPNPYVRISACINIARKNWVSGARHALRLVDGSLGNVPTQPGGTGGFTVASDNPVYILGNYNADSTEQGVWTTETTPPTGEAAASIIADSVTLLSNNFATGGTTPPSVGDIQTFLYPFAEASRNSASTTYYRVAISSGKNKTFQSPSWNTTVNYGTDGGVHNFLRFIENWGGQTLYYKGSMVSLYYSTYATGAFKCCGGVVYNAPSRQYVFDSLFSQPQNLPPGTPMFRDVDNMSYRQDLTPRTGAY